MCSFTYLIHLFISYFRRHRCGMLSRPSNLNIGCLQRRGGGINRIRKYIGHTIKHAIISAAGCVKRTAVLTKQGIEEALSPIQCY